MYIYIYIFFFYIICYIFIKIFVLIYVACVSGGYYVMAQNLFTHSVPGLQKKARRGPLCTVSDDVARSLCLKLKACSTSNERWTCLVR